MTLFLVQEWLDTWHATHIVAFLEHVCVEWLLMLWFQFRFTPCEAFSNSWISLLNNTLNIMVIPFACVHFPIMLFSSWQLSIYILCYNKQLSLSIMTFCYLLYIKAVSMSDIWISVKSAILPIIAVVRTEPIGYIEFVL